MAGQITVVVPMYNVEPYLEACLTSIARQTFSDLDVVMVDDGSSDATGAIAARFAAQDDRFRLVTQANAGLGAARNTGVDHATGDFLAFLDSDDIVPPDAYELLHATLAETGSDFASGVVRRFGRATSSRSRLTPFRQKIQRTHVSQQPDDLLVDRIATNKLWRRSFWDAHALRFPEGVLYEDISVVLYAHVVAKSVDVLPDTVYWWRLREASITQDRAVPHGIVDRLRAVRHVIDYMGEQGLDDLQRHYEAMVLADDMLLFVNTADQGDADYRQALVDQTRGLLSITEPVVLERIPAIDRLKYHLLERGLVAEMLDVLTFERLSIDASATMRSGLELYGRYPFFNDPALDIPRDVYRLNVEVQPVAMLEGAVWEGDALRISGYAYIDRVEAKRPRDTAIRILIRDADGSIRSIAAKSRHNSQATIDAAQTAHNYDGTGFTALLDVGSIFPDLSDGATAAIGIDIDIEGIRRTSFEWGTSRGLHRRVQRRSYRGLSLQPTAEAGAFTISTERVRASVASVRTVGDQLQIKGVLRGKLAGRDVVFSARRRVGGVTFETPILPAPSATTPRDFTLDIPVTELAELVGPADEPAAAALRGDGITWRLRLRPGSAYLTTDESFGEASCVVDGVEYQIRANRSGHAVLIERALHPIVSRFEPGGDGVVHLEGTIPGRTGAAELVLRRRRTGEERRVDVALQDGRFTLDLPVLELPQHGDVAPLGSGQWELFLSGHDEGDDVLPLLAGGQVVQSLPITTRIGERLVIGMSMGSRRLGIDMISASERNPYVNETKRAQTYSRRRRFPLRNVAVFEAAEGEGFGGDPRAIAARLDGARDLKVVWVARDAHAGMEPVVERDTPAHAALLATARWIVTDDLLPRWWQPRDGQRVLQTWHGTPVKRHGFALPEDAAAAARTWLAELRRQASAWDVLLSPSAAAAEVLRATLGYDGLVAPLGAPRLDALIGNSGSADSARRLRAALGVAEHERVVLWTPTARDEGLAGRRRSLGVTFDLREAPDILGDGYRFLLHRHPALRQDFGATPRSWVDVSGYPDVTGLLQIADVLVTDYSSLALDFLVTGRPLVLFAPDLEHYLERTGGLSIDLYGDPLGPVCSTSAEALAAIANSAGVTPNPAYVRLRDTYNGPLDGGAAQRVADRIRGRH